MEEYMTKKPINWDVKDNRKKISETKNSFLFEKINKLDERLARQTNKKRDKTQIKLELKEE